MKNLLLSFVLSSALIGCTDGSNSSVKSDAEKSPAANVNAGRVIAERDCRACHGLDGKGAAPAIPHLAAQREQYMLASINEYVQGRRTHAALKELMGHLSTADVRDVVAYYASLSPVTNAVASDFKHSSPYDQGRKHAAACAKCHGQDGNSKVSGTPTLAGQQPHYLVAAIQEYHKGDRAKGTTRSMLRDSDRLELENLALYFAAQTPVSRSASRKDAVAGEALSAKCGGCHGSSGVSTDAATPSLAGQDFEYLVKAIRSYRNSRRNWGMQRYVAGLGDRDIENIAAFYSAQMPKAAERVPSSTQELAQKCDRCHDQNDTPAMAAPRLRSQDRDYLIMALRAYRDGRRESSTMHNMSFPYSNAIIDSLATWYASQPGK